MSYDPIFVIDRGECEVCGSPSDWRIRCVDLTHRHRICTRCDVYILNASSQGRRYGDRFSVCPDKLSEADRVVMALREGTTA